MDALGIFAKQPVPGGVKTRLAAAVGHELAARAHRAFVEDLLERFRNAADQRLIVFTPDDARGFFQGIAAGQYDLLPQGTGDLGQRLQRFFASVLGGARAEQTPGPDRRVVVIGSDSPTLPLTYVEEAFRLLGSNDVVIGPSTDGGYYLIGCRALVPALFTDMAWGGSHVLAQTVSRLSGTAHRMALLPPWYDVDTIDDWNFLVGHVAAQRRAGVDPGVPRTERLIPLLKG